jgi:TonB family protein
VAGWTLILLLGVGALWAFEPEHGVAPGVRTSVNMMANTQRSLFDKCKRPRIRGEVVVRYTIDNGRVASAVSVDRTTIANPEVERCVTTTAQQLRFTPRDGTATVVMPVQFR